MMMFLLFMMILLFLNSVGYLYLNRRAGAGILRLRGYRNYSHFRMEELLEARYDSLVFLVQQSLTGLVTAAVLVLCACFGCSLDGFFRLLAFWDAAVFLLGLWGFMRGMDFSHCRPARHLRDVITYSVPLALAGFAVSLVCLTGWTGVVCTFLFVFLMFFHSR